MQDRTVPQRHRGARPGVERDTVVGPDLGPLQRQRPRVAAHHVGVPADQYEPLDDHRREGVQDGAPGPCHHDRSGTPDRDQPDLAADGERLLVVAGLDLDQRRPSAPGRLGEGGSDVPVGAPAPVR